MGRESGRRVKGGMGEERGEGIGGKKEKRASRWMECAEGEVRPGKTF